MFDITIIGAGIVGLATAHRLLEIKPGLRIAVFEKEKTVAFHQSSRNSGVIHSGIYYQPGSQKALNCRKGYDALLHFCKAHGIQHDICGKVIVATKKEELGLLDNIYQRGLANGLKGIRKIGPDELKEKEPYAQGIEAIWVPQAGIISYKSVAEKYLERINLAGAAVFLGEKVQKVVPGNSAVTVCTSHREIQTRQLIACSGLYADHVAKLTGEQLNLKILPFRGEYYELKKEKEYLVNNLIYPVPNPAFPFLGVHFTRMIEGGIESGPNAVLAFRREGYHLKDFEFKEFFEMIGFKGLRKLAAKYWRLELDEFHRSFSKRAFLKSLQKLIPAIGYDDIEIGRSGVRAQAVGNDGSLVDDFFIVEKGPVINVLNAPSPAATASLAIGERIANTALRKHT